MPAEPDPSQAHRTRKGAPSGLSRLAVGGVFWQGLSLVLGKGFTLAATIILARLLTPDDFGLVGLALVFITFAEYGADLGVAQALVYFPRDRRNENAALGLSLLTGGGLCAAGVLLAPLVADFFDDPRVTPMFQVLSASLLVTAARQVPDALLRRELRFRRRVATELARAVVQGIVSVVLAMAGFGPWAIVWGYVAGNLVWSVAAWVVVDYRPGRFWRLTASTARPLLAYGAPAAAQGLLAALIFDVDYLIVGKLLGPEALGYYTLAFRLPQLLIINVFFVLSAVAFPMFSRAREDVARLRRGYLTSVRLQSTYGVAAGVGLFMIAPMVVTVAFGPKWTESAVPLQALALYAAFRSLGTGAVDVYKGIGRPGLAALVALGRFAALVPALLVAARSGIEAVAWTQAALALVFAVGMQGVASRIVGLSLADLAAALRPALAVAVGTAAGAGAVRFGLPGPEELRLGVALAAGGGLGFAALWLADAQFVRDVKALLTRRGGAPAVAPT